MMLSSLLLTTDPQLVDLSVGNAGVYALLGYAVVFAGLICLMLVVMAIGKFFTGAAKKNAGKSAEAAAPAQEAPVVSGPVAPGTAGELKLYDVDPKTAAMLMAIVADKMGKPLNELRFISVREVK